MTKYILLVLAGAISFGILSSFVKLAYRLGYSPAEISFSQAFTGAMVLWLLVIIRRKKDKNPYSSKRKINWPLLLTGASIGLSTFVYYLSVLYIPASLAIVILMQFTWLGIVLDWIFFKIRPTVVDILVTVVILAGTVMAGNLIAHHSEPISIKGILYALLASLLYAIYIVANSRTGKNVPLLDKSAIIVTGSATAIFLVNCYPILTTSHFNGNLLYWALFLALFGTIIPPLLFSHGIPKIGAGLSAILMTAELPVAVVCAHFILAEPVNLIQWAGILIMLCSIAGMNLYQINKKKSAVELLVPAPDHPG